MPDQTKYSEERNEVISQVEKLCGNYPNCSPTVYEVDYILTLQGDYRRLAIMQAAKGLLVKYMADQVRIEYLTVEIQKLAVELAKKEAYQVEKAAWKEEYDYIQYKVIDGKIKSSIDLTLPEEKCDKCNNGKITTTAGYSYPCECPLGDKWAKNTGYMGPVGVPSFKPKNAPYVDTAAQKIKAQKITAELAKKEAEKAKTEQLKFEQKKKYNFADTIKNALGLKEKVDTTTFPSDATYSYTYTTTGTTNTTVPYMPGQVINVSGTSDMQFLGNHEIEQPKQEEKPKPLAEEFAGRRFRNAEGT